MMMFKNIKDYNDKKHKKGGKKPKLSVKNILVMYLKYYRDYNTFFSLGNIFSINEANAYRWIKWCEEIISTAFFSMINEITNMTKINIMHEHLVDVTECSVQRAKTQEIQIIMDEITKKIVGITFDKGSVHDFKLFKNSTTNLNSQ